MAEETTMGQAPPHILTAIRSVMQDVGGVAKAGTGPKTQGGYSYRKVDDVIDAIGASMREHGVMIQSRDLVIAEHPTMIKSDRGGEVEWTTVSLTITYLLTSLVDGSTLEFRSAGGGRDNSDKAVSKALSMALKYALSQALMLATGDPDPDAQSPQVHRQSAGRSAPADAQADPEAGTQSEAATSHRLVTEACERAVHRQSASLPEPVLTEQQVERARKALAAARSAPSATYLDRMINFADEIGILDATVDGEHMAATLAAIRGTL